jgi:hypothetical protein
VVRHSAWWTMAQVLEMRSGRRRFERIQRRNLEPLEVSHIPCHDREIVRLGGRRDHGVLDAVVRMAVEKARPAAERSRVHGQHVVRIGDLINPCLDLDRLVRVPVSRDLDAGLQFADRDGGQVKVRIGNGPKPGENGAMRSGPPQFGNHIGVEQIHRRSAEAWRRAPALLAALGDGNLGERLFGQQKVFEGRPRGLPQPAPFVDRHKHGRLCAALRYNLRAVPQACLKKFTEARLGVLHGPACQNAFPTCSIRPSQITSLKRLTMQIRRGKLSDRPHRAFSCNGEALDA